MDQEKLNTEFYPMYDFLAAKVRNLLTDPIELYTKWGMVRGVIKGMHLYDHSAQKDIECYLLKDDWSVETPCMVFPVRGNYFTVFQQSTFIEESVLKEVLQKGLEEYESIESDENPEIVRNVHFFFYLEKTENPEENATKLKKMIHELFAVKVLSSKLMEDEYWNSIDLQILGTFSQDELRTKLYPWFPDPERWPSPYGINASSCLLENVKHCLIYFKRY